MTITLEADVLLPKYQKTLNDKPIDIVGELLYYSFHSFEKRRTDMTGINTANIIMCCRMLKFPGNQIDRCVVSMCI